MTQQQIIVHWRKGAQDSIEVARMCLEAQKYEHAFFHCHLAIEKALKATYMDQHGKDHPYTHDLPYLASLVDHHLAAEDVALLKELTAFVTDARYSDPYWAQEQATKENTRRWVEVAERMLSQLLP